jgi:hypothetical protein
MEFFRIAGPYDWTDNDIVIDQHKPGTIVGNWIGNYGANIPDSAADYHSWRRLILGCNSQWWWTLRYAFNGDNTPVRRFAANTEAFARIHGGLGDLALESRMTREPVALPHCPPSELVSLFHAEFTSILPAKDAAREILADLGLRHWRIPMARIAAGELERAGHRVLLLPYHQAMSAEDAAAIERFATAGGVVVADVRPAIFNEHGRPLERGLLDALFGIARLKAEGAGSVRGKPVFKAGGWASAAFDGFQGELTADKLVKPLPGVHASGEVGGAPICLSRSVGKGKAILLNFALDDYATLRTTGSAEPLRRLLGGILAEAGISPTVRVTCQGRTLDGCHLTRWENGPMRLVAIDRYPIEPSRDAPARVTVKWPERGRVYDVRACKDLGVVDTVETDLAVHTPAMYAWLPYAVGDVKIAAPASVRPGQRVNVGVALSLAAEKRAAHVVTLDVFGPDGAWRYWDRERLVLTGPEAQAVLALEHNAPPGRWTLRATEAVTGRRAEHALVVEAEGGQK